MLFIIPIALVSILLLAAFRPQRSSRFRAEQLGTMSEQWLAECNASRRTPSQ